MHEGQTKKNYLFLTTSKIRLTKFFLAQNRFPEAEQVAEEAPPAALR